MPAVNEPAEPVEPTRPAQPGQPAEPAEPAQAGRPAQPTGGAGTGPSGLDRAEARRALHAPFRPRRARQVALVISSTEVLVLSVLALVLPGTGPEAFQWYDRLGVFLVGLAIGAGVLRFGQLAILPGEDGLTVRNLLFSRQLAWAEVVAVRFGGGGPWVTLDLADGDTLAAMAVQRADGAFGEAEARRLATLVALHSQTERDD